MTVNLIYYRCCCFSYYLLWGLGQCLFFCFWDKVSLCGPGWPQTWRYPVITASVLTAVMKIICHQAQLRQYILINFESQFKFLNHFLPSDGHMSDTEITDCVSLRNLAAHETSLMNATQWWHILFSIRTIWGHMLNGIPILSSWTKHTSHTVIEVKLETDRWFFLICRARKR